MNINYPKKDFIEDGALDALLKRLTRAEPDCTRTFTPVECLNHIGTAPFLLRQDFLP
jgi:hypothetical protein